MRKNKFVRSLPISLLVFTIMLLTAGCTSIAKKWKAMISSDSDKPKSASLQRATNGATYSQQNNLMPTSYRKYKRSKRKDIEDDAHLESKSGSLWVMEGQGAYLFSQNTVRLIGDPIAVRIEGDPAEQLIAKTKVISTLLAQIKERRRRAMGRNPAGENKKDEDKKTDAAPVEGAPGATNQPPNPAVAAAGAQSTAPPEAKQEFNVKTVPTRIIDRMVDGNYRVRGAQPFLIDEREYKVIVTGIIRAEDFNEEGIAASQLLDASFDIVSGKSTEMR